MSVPRPLTPEELRILRAAADYRLVTEPSGRWIITGEARPCGRARQHLLRKGLIDNPVTRPRWSRLVATQCGLDWLADSSQSGRIA